MPYLYRSFKRGSQWLASASPGTPSSTQHLRSQPFYSRNQDYVVIVTATKESAFHKLKHLFSHSLLRNNPQAHGSVTALPQSSTADPWQGPAEKITPRVKEGEYAGAGEGRQEQGSSVLKNAGEGGAGGRADN